MNNMMTWTEDMTVTPEFMTALEKFCDGMSENGKLKALTIVCATIFLCEVLRSQSREKGA